MPIRPRIRARAARPARADRLRGLAGRAFGERLRRVGRAAESDVRGRLRARWAGGPRLGRMSKQCVFSRAFLEGARSISGFAGLFSSLENGASCCSAMGMPASARSSSAIADFSGWTGRRVRGAGVRGGRDRHGFRNRRRLSSCRSRPGGAAAWRGVRALRATRRRLRAHRAGRGLG